ncbi:MAG: hypothetical protein L3J63_01955 [Geopsychrobacter sp.]|nr:hypothetical protein [Geopsychrobacter sp.]
MTILSRWSVLLLAGLMLTGCSLSLLKLPASPEANLFTQGLDNYLASGDLTTLQQLPRQYPQGVWRTQAEGIVEMANRHQAILKEQDQRLLNLQKNDELTRCRQEKIDLAQDNLLLEKTLKRLKDVLIDTELQAK